MGTYKFYDNNKVSIRLKELRDKNHFSQSELAKKLNFILDKQKDKTLILEGETGKQTVSQLERETSNRKPTIDIAFAYANLFGVSLDYILGMSDDYMPDYEKLKKETGLSDEAIQKLKKLNSENNSYDNKRDKLDIEIDLRFNKLFNLPRKFLE